MLSILQIQMYVKNTFKNTCSRPKTGYVIMNKIKAFSPNMTESPSVHQPEKILASQKTSLRSKNKSILSKITMVRKTRKPQFTQDNNIPCLDLEYTSVECNNRLKSHGTNIPWTNIKAQIVRSTWKNPGHAVNVERKGVEL